MKVDEKMLADHLLKLGVERGAWIATAAAAKVLGRLVRDRGDPSAVAVQDLEQDIVREDPVDPMIVALRCSNAQTLTEFVSAVATLSLFKVRMSSRDGRIGEFGGPCLHLAGIMMENLATVSESEKACNLFETLSRVRSSDDVAAALLEYG